MCDKKCKSLFGWAGVEATGADCSEQERVKVSKAVVKELNLGRSKLQRRVGAMWHQRLREGRGG